MPSVLEQIRSRKIVSEEIPQQSEIVHPSPRELALPLPPARHCLTTDCPCPAAIWITIYDRDSPTPEFRCYGCDPPPSWSFVGARWLLTIPDGRWTWELFPRFDPRHDAQEAAGSHENALAVFWGMGEAGGRESDAQEPWQDREPTMITAADGSRITILEPTGWNDLLRLTVKHGTEEAWRLLQFRTDLKLPRAVAAGNLAVNLNRIELELAEL